METKGRPRAVGEGTLCQVCGDAFTDGEPVVYCRDCGTPHHEACFRYARACSTYACLCTACVDAAGAPVWEGEEERLRPGGGDLVERESPQSALKEMGGVALGLGWLVFSAMASVAAGGLVLCIVIMGVVRNVESSPQAVLGAVLVGLYLACHTCAQVLAGFNGFERRLRGEPLDGEPLDGEPLSCSSADDASEPEPIDEPNTASTLFGIGVLAFSVLLYGAYGEGGFPSIPFAGGSELLWGVAAGLVLAVAGYLRFRSRPRELSSGIRRGDEPPRRLTKGPSRDRDAGSPDGS